MRSNQPDLAELTELIKYILLSDYLKLDLEQKECSLSSIIISAVESGKTSIVEQFIPANGVLCVTDITAYGLQKFYINRLKWNKDSNGEPIPPPIRRIVIPDLINPINRKEETASSLIAFLNAYISWEGVRDIATYAVQISVPPDRPIRGALLTTMATQDYLLSKRKFKAIGFMSRILPIYYQYDQETMQQILLSIARRERSWSPQQVLFPTELVDVHLEDQYSEQVIDTAKLLGTKLGGKGARATHQFMTLLRCRALAEGRDEVNQEDVDRVKHLAEKYISLPPEVEDL